MAQCFTPFQWFHSSTPFQHSSPLNADPPPPPLTTVMHKSSLVPRPSSTPYPKIRKAWYKLSREWCHRQTRGRHDLIERGHTQQPHPLQLTVKLGGRQAWSFWHKPTPAEVSSLQPLPAVDAGSFGVVLIAGKHACMFRMHGCKSNRAQANEIDHNLWCQSCDKFHQAFLSLIFFWGHREEGLGTRLAQERWPYYNT